MPLFASRGTTALAAARPQPRCRVKCSWILALALATAAPAFAGSDTAPSRGACGEAAYVPGMAGFVLVSRGTTALAPRLDPLKAILATLEPPLPPYQRPLPLRTLSLAS